MASCGHNGNNETRIGMSPSISLSFYDEKLNELVIDQTSMPIEILIKRDKNNKYTIIIISNKIIYYL